MAIRVTKAGLQIEYLIADDAESSAGCLPVYASERGNCTVVYNGVDMTPYCTAANMEAIVTEVDATNLTSDQPVTSPGGTSWKVSMAGYLSKAVDDLLGRHAVSPPDPPLYGLVVKVGPEDCQSLFSWAGGGPVGAFVTNYKVGPNDPLRELTTWRADLGVSGGPGDTTVTRVRRWQSGAESALTTVGGAGGEFTHTEPAFVVSDTWSQSGGFSYRTIDDAYAEQSIAETHQAQTGFYANHNGGTGEPYLVTFLADSVEAVRLAWNVTAQQLRLYVGNVLVASASSAAFATTATAIRCGIDINIAANGWFYLYIDGEIIIAYNGNLTGGGSNFNTVRYGNSDSGQTWSAYLYLDDLYIDDMTGATESALPPLISIAVIFPTGDSTPLDWTPNSGSTHYTQVDDPGVSDDNTTYVSINSDGSDRYMLGDIGSLTAGTTIAAVIPFALVRRDTIGAFLNFRLSSVDGVTHSYSEVITPLVAYTYADVRVSARANGSNWDVSSVNALELNIEVI